MPFNNPAILELRVREKLTQEKLVQKLEELAKEQGNSKFIMDHSYISLLESGKRTPSLSIIDLFYNYARNRGHEDLNFYIRPARD